MIDFPTVPNPRRALIVEDAVIDGHLIKTYLDCVPCLSFIALDYVRANAILSSQRPSLIVLNLEAHHAELAIETAIALVPEIRIIGLGTLNGSARLEACFRNGLHTFISRPCDPSCFIGEARRLLGSPMRAVA